MAAEASDRAPLHRDDLPGRTVEVLHRGGSRNPDVLLVQSDAGLVVVKDFAPRGRWFRAGPGRWLAAREIRAYRVLAGLPWVPRYLGRVDALAFAVEYRPGRRLSRRVAPSLPPGFVASLGEAIAAMHARGVVHLDLRHRSNVLVDAAGAPVLIDFASALVLPVGSPLGRWLLAQLARVDRAALAKWRQRFPEPAAGSSSGGGDADAAGSPRGASRPT